MLKSPSVSEAKKLLATKRQKAWTELALKYGKSFWYQGALVTCEPELVEILLMQKVHTQKRSALYNLAGYIPGASGLLFMDGKPWRRRTQAVMPTFSKAQIDNFPKFIHKITITYAAQWQDGQYIDDLFAAMMELGAIIALHIGCGLAPENPLSQKLAKELILYKSQTMNPNSKMRLDEFGLDTNQFWHLPLMIKGIMKLKERVDKIRSIIQDIMQQRDQPSNANWIQGLDQAGFSLQDITNQVNHLYGAFNAIDFSITCAFYELSKHPEWAEKIRQEFQQVLGERSYPTRQDFPSLIQTMNFMKEIFRMYPVAMAVGRRTGDSIQIGANTIPKNKEVLILISALHYHPDFWDNPEIFNPNRWLAFPSPRVPYSYIPFLDGPRQCIGRHWAELEFVVILNALLRHFQFDITNQNMQMTPFVIPRFDTNMTCLIRKC